MYRIPAQLLIKRRSRKIQKEGMTGLLFMGRFILCDSLHFSIKSKKNIVAKKLLFL